MKDNLRNKLTKYWKFVIIFTGVVILFNILARFQIICDFYVDKIFRYVTLPYCFFTGLFPFSVGGVMIVIGVILLLLGILFSVLLIFLRKKEKYKKFTLTYLKSILVMGLVVGMLMTLNCSTLYRCSKINDGNREYTDKELKIVYSYVVEKCNELAVKINRDANSEATYEGNLMEAVRDAVEDMGVENKRYRGYTPKAKVFINNYIYYQTGIIGEYYPFSMEANYSKYLNDVTMASTIAHEMAHLKGYIYEDEANFMGFLTCINSDNEFLQYAGYVSVWWHLFNDIICLDEPEEFFADIPEVNWMTWEEDSQTYSYAGMKKIEETEPIIPDEVVSDISDTITDTYLDYYQSEANYSEVTKLVMWYYEGKLF